MRCTFTFLLILCGLLHLGECKKSAAGRKVLVLVGDDQAWRAAASYAPKGANSAGLTNLVVLKLKDFVDSRGTFTMLREVGDQFSRVVITAHGVSSNHPSGLPDICIYPNIRWVEYSGAACAPDGTDPGEVANGANVVKQVASKLSYAPQFILLMSCNQDTAAPWGFNWLDQFWRGVDDFYFTEHPGNTVVVFAPHGLRASSEMFRPVFENANGAEAIATLTSRYRMKKVDLAALEFMPPPLVPAPNSPRRRLF